MSTQTKPYITPEQYLEIERRAEFRSEYCEGEMYPMEAATRNHARIKVNAGRILANHLIDRPCELALGDLAVRVSPGGPYFYPDIVVCCAESQKGPEENILTDASVIMEILSPSTDYYDRSFKFEQFRKLPSLTDYLAISQHRFYVEHHKSHGPDEWIMRVITNLDTMIQLPAIECGLLVSDLYLRVDFKAAASL